LLITRSQQTGIVMAQNVLNVGGSLKLKAFYLGQKFLA
jgi:hypothetical protein